LNLTVVERDKLLVQKMDELCKYKNQYVSDETFQMLISLTPLPGGKSSPKREFQQMT
jgi:hypothetical protein